MSHSIFIRSYRGDLDWLKYCLRSIEKFATGFDRVHVVVPIGQRAEFISLVPDVAVCGLSCEDDYMGQQATKMHADLFAGEGTITFIDSDCIFTAPVTPETFVDEAGRPIIIMVPYTEFPPDFIWRGATESFMGAPVAFEFMQRMPLTFRGSHLREIREWFEVNGGEDLLSYIRGVQGRRFSEFNAMGAWAYVHRRDDYCWLDTTKDELPPRVVLQHWSYAGISPEIQSTIEDILK